MEQVVRMTAEEYTRKSQSLLEGSHIPPAFYGVFQSHAYEKGHAGGYEDVLIELQDLVDAFDATFAKSTTPQADPSVVHIFCPLELRTVVSAYLQDCRFGEDDDGRSEAYFMRHHKLSVAEFTAVEDVWTRIQRAFTTPAR